MSYTTIDVDIDHGLVRPKDGTKLPEKAHGILTILTPEQARELLKLPSESPRALGLAMGEFRVPDDFNAPLPDEVLKGFEGT
jgi:hypothetical protein